MALIIYIVPYAVSTDGFGVDVAANAANSEGDVPRYIYRKHIWIYEIH